MSETTNTNDPYMQAIELTCGNEKLRREMLWLRAMEKQDEDCARALERIDPDLRARMADIRSLADGVDQRTARQIYGRAQDERLHAVLAIIERQNNQNGSA